eukprot:scaffold879_cov410-Prasinococcus_capsulatus_cf.AAC.24
MSALPQLLLRETIALTPEDQGHRAASSPSDALAVRCAPPRRVNPTAARQSASASAASTLTTRRCCSPRSPHKPALLSWPQTLPPDL